MIEIHPLRDKEKLAILYKENNVDFSEGSIAIVASDRDDILGFCLFDLKADKGIVHKISPKDDISFADGLLRSALHVLVENGIMDVFYSENMDVKLLDTLKFIKNAQNKELDVNRLFTSCKNC